MTLYVIYIQSETVNLSLTQAPSNPRKQLMNMGRSSQHIVPLSSYSTPLVPNSNWAATDFILGAGMVIIQPSSRKIVIVHDPPSKAYFLPRGRKDIGESLEQTALREAYEESGYRVTSLPVYTRTNAPPPPHDLQARTRPNIEPIYTTVTSYGGVVRQGRIRPPGEYLVFWYVGQISENAVRELDTGMPDEKDYVSYLVDVEVGFQCLHPSEARVLRYAWDAYNYTLEVEERERLQLGPTGN